jgi:hypothetical protein
MAVRGPSHPERSFGVSVGAAALLAAVYLGWHGSIQSAIALAVLGTVLLGLGLTSPRALYWPSRIWWKVAQALGYVNARIILTVLYVVLLVPLGLFWRMWGKDPLARRRTHGGWEPYPARYRDPKHYLRMY